MIDKSFPPSKNLVQGDDWKITCKVTGFPYPEVHWSKKGEPLPDDNRIHIEDDGPYVGAKLLIYSLTFEDQGDYECYSNSTGAFNGTSAIVKLRVKGNTNTYLYTISFILLLIDFHCYCF